MWSRRDGREGAKAIASRPSATAAAATNKLFRAIQLELPESGLWHLEVTVGSPERIERVEVELEVGPPLPSWINLSLWIGWPAAAIALFLIHQHLARRRTDLQSVAKLP